MAFTDAPETYVAMQDFPDTLTLKERFHSNCTNKMPRTNLSVVII
jgi:hypothetical protein